MACSRFVRQSRPLCLCAMLVALASAPASGPVAAADDWFPLHRHELAESKPRIQHDADAEILFWDVHIEDMLGFFFSGTEWWHYVRVKVFTERGKELAGQVRLPYGGHIRVADIAGRTITPDGRVIRLDRRDIFDRAILGGAGVSHRVRSKSFMMPGVERGAIVEYRWREVHRNEFAGARPVRVPRHLPVRQASYHLKSPRTLDVIAFNGELTDLGMDPHGFKTIAMFNVRPGRSEPMDPPDLDTEPWLLVRHKDAGPGGHAYWSELAREYHRSLAARWRLNKRIRATADSLASGITDSTEVLRRLFDFCQRSIRCISEDASGYTPAQRRKLQRGETAAQVLRHGAGTHMGVNLLFVALASAAGFEAALALGSDRDEVAFRPEYSIGRLLTTPLSAVKRDGRWKLHDPSAPYASVNMLPWRSEGSQALVLRGGNLEFASGAIAPPESSRIQRQAALVLEANGSLEGGLSISYAGHHGATMKRRYEGLSRSERDRRLKEDLTAGIGPTIVSDVECDGLDDPGDVVRCHARVKIEAAARVAAGRVWLPPAVFHRSASPPFPHHERHRPVSFPHLSLEHDSLTITLTPGHALDLQPASWTVGDARSGHEYRLEMELEEAARSIVVTRVLRRTQREIAAGNYDALKETLDRIQRVDQAPLPLARLQP